MRVEDVKVGQMFEVPDTATEGRRIEVLELWSDKAVVSSYYRSRLAGGEVWNRRGRPNKIALHRLTKPWKYSPLPEEEASRTRAGFTFPKQQ